MKVRRLVLIACGVLVAIFASIAIAVHYLDPRALAASFAASVKADTGRELSFGEVEIRLLPRPALELSQVRFGNAAWGAQPWLAQVGSVRADFDALALLAGRLRLKGVALSNASVSLETDREGNGNWVMGSGEGRVPAWLKSLEIDAINLQALAVSYRNGATGKTTQLQFDTAEFSASSASSPIHLALRMTFDGKPVEASATFGALAALLANESAYPVELNARLGAASVGMKGTIDNLRELGGLRLAAQAQAPEFAELAALFGATVAPIGAFRGEAQVTGAATAFEFSGMNVEIGARERIGLTARGTLKGSVAAGGGYEWNSGGVEVVLQGAQFGDLARWSGRPVPALGPYRIAARAAGSMAAPGLTAIDAKIGGRDAPGIILRGTIANARAASGIDLKMEATASAWWRIGTAAAPRLPPFRARDRKSVV
jgi:uncharacterized protein involved in outer membrane biogenesis